MSDFCLALATLFAIWFIEEDLASQTFKLNSNGTAYLTRKLVFSILYQIFN